MTQRNSSRLIETGGIVVMVAVTVAMTWRYFAVPFLDQRATAHGGLVIPNASIPVKGPSEGKQDADVVVLEFSDFQCPYCALFAETTFETLKQRYIDSGQVRFVFNQFPLEGIHRSALTAAIASECANRQQSFWPAHDALFRGRRETTAVVETLAQRLSINREQFMSCRSSPEALQSVRANIELGQRLNVTGTPAFFIGRSIGPDNMRVAKAFVGNISVEAFGKAIESMRR